jgi:hypothetical protein
VVAPRHIDFDQAAGENVSTRIGKTNSKEMEKQQKDEKETSRRRRRR